MRRREGDGCPISGALQVVGDKWTMLVVRDLAAGPKRTTELLSNLHPISSRTLVGRLRDMEQDNLIERREFAGSPPRVEYELTTRGRKLLPMLEALRSTGVALDCATCDDHIQQTGSPCASCPDTNGFTSKNSASSERSHRNDDSIVLL